MNNCLILQMVIYLGEVGSKARKIPKDIAGFQRVQEHISKSELDLVQQLKFDCCLISEQIGMNHLVQIR